jgi:hypothetical protein
MKKLFIILCVFMFLLVMANVGQAYTINDLSNDSIGTGFESYGINIYNYTPGVNSGAIALSIYTNYPQSGLTIGSWNTTPADLFIRETYYGKNYLWAIPTVNNGSFVAGNMYAVGAFKVSDDFAPSSGYIYNHNVPVEISAIGNNYGHTQFNGSVNWVNIGSNPNNRVDILTSVYQDDPNGKWFLTWGTATCGNDVVNTPIPGSLILLLSGLLGISIIGIRKKCLN